MTSQDSLLARSLEPLAASLWTLFVIVSVLVGGVWAFAIGDGMVERCVGHPDLRAALEWMLAQADLAWITLAAMNVYLVLAAHEGLATARRWALLIFIVVVALGWLSTRTGFPLGPIQYGTPLGAKLGPVPLGLPLLWVAVILAVRETVLL